MRLIPVATNSRAYRLKTPLEIYQSEWNLTVSEKANLSNFALRHWNITELLDMLELATDSSNDLTVRLWNVVYCATFKVSPATLDKLRYMVVREKSWRDPINDKQPMFWLSFRAGTYEGTEFAYVIVQEDKKGKA